MVSCPLNNKQQRGDAIGGSQKCCFNARDSPSSGESPAHIISRPVAVTISATTTNDIPEDTGSVITRALCLGTVVTTPHAPHVAALAKVAPTSLQGSEETPAPFPCEAVLPALLLASLEAAEVPGEKNVQDRAWPGFSLFPASSFWNLSR
ncbi:uncharacterized protein LOC104865328 isoform X9 [Fukomys damarensis]|uniref:uncharacterized protein LOC104865328 isoform X9 n=1 Tax=Fukomys damarensis TaxID=885580 RepID=UPI0005401448|nr:uncharacterized protein LOC104865328 isoform X9 [Fukomys damarensis]